MSDQTMTLDKLYQSMMQNGNLRTTGQASRITFAVLRTLGFNLSRSVKGELAKALPDEFARELKRGWRLVNIRHRNMTIETFAKDVARNSGNTDVQVGITKTRLVFHYIKALIDDDISRKVARDLSPEVRDLWNAA
ncbi:MAG: hypothetical protein DCC51_12965 [Anaerolineae bacterium]|nr:MAG: hypothetical protein DCC51_12965 [Anaerolineae bacterium]